MIKKQVKLTDKDVFEFEEKEQATEEQQEDNVPQIGSPEWTPFILSQLASDEKVNEKPKCSGIRRLVEKYVGPIVERRIVQCFPPQSMDGIATIVFGVKILVQNKQHPSFPIGQLWEEDVADAGKYNTPAPFFKHQSSTASTRAEARVLRRILRINVIAAEEGSMDESQLGSTDSWEPEDKINETQMNFIEILCQRCDLNVLEFINCGSIQYKSINDITQDQAAKMIKYLDSIQRGENPKPNNVGNFKEGSN